MPRTQNVLAAQWSPNGESLGSTDLTRRGQPGLRHQRLLARHPAPAPAQDRLPAPAGDALSRRGDRHLAGRPDRRRDEGLGDGEGRDPLHALVPAADRLDGREARLVLRAHGRGHGDRRLLRQGAHPGRARRVVLPHRRHPRHLRGPRLHRVGPDEPGLHPREPQRRRALHPDGVRVLDGRGARQQDPAAALDGRAVQGGDPRAAPVRRPGRPAGVHDRRPRAGVLPDRRAVLLRAARPDQHRPHAVRRQAAEGPRARRPLLRLDPRADPGLHARRRARAGQARRADQDPPQRGRPEPVRDGPDVRELERRLRPPAAHHAGHAAGGPALRPRGPAAREALRRRQRLGQAQQLVDGHRHRAATCSSRATRRTRTCSSCSSARRSSRPSTSTRRCCGRRSPRPARTTAWARTRRRRPSSRSSSAPSC